MESFVDVRNVFVEQKQSAPTLKRLLGRKAVTHSLLRNVNLQIPLGSWVTLFGKPAAGKTTLLRLLTGVISPTSGTAHVNGVLPGKNKQAAAGYVNAQELWPAMADSVEDMLETFCLTHNIHSGASRVMTTAKTLKIEHLLPRLGASLSASEKLNVALARAIISEAPLLLLDDVADVLDIGQLQHVLGTLCQGRTVIISTRSAVTAQQLELPIVLLHEGSVAHFGTCDDIATNVACPRILDVWVEGLRYDLLKSLRRHPGVVDVRLISADQFAGQRLRITLHSSRYLPGIYDLMSQTDLVKVQELPPSLADILARL